MAKSTVSTNSFSEGEHILHKLQELESTPINPKLSYLTVGKQRGRTALVPPDLDINRVNNIDGSTHLNIHPLEQKIIRSLFVVVVDVIHPIAAKNLQNQCDMEMRSSLSRLSLIFALNRCRSYRRNELSPSSFPPIVSRLSQGSALFLAT
eukprot:761732-Hanusia_phi.AAC.3